MEVAKPNGLLSCWRISLLRNPWSRKTGGTEHIIRDFKAKEEAEVLVGPQKFSIIILL